MLGRDGRTPATAPSTAQYAALGDLGWIHCTALWAFVQNRGYSVQSLVELGNKEATLDILYFKWPPFKVYIYMYIYLDNSAQYYHGQLL